MRRWFPALWAAAAVEASAGVALTALALAWGTGHRTVSTFLVYALAIGLADFMLVPGWVWAPLRWVPLRLAHRAFGALTSIALGVGVTWCLIWIGLLLSLRLVDVVSEWLLICIAILIPILVGGIVAGLGATVTEAWNHYPGTVAPLRRFHIVGGVFGAVSAVVAAGALNTIGLAEQPPPGQWWKLLVIMLVVPPLAGSFRTILMAREAVRTGTILAVEEGMAWRTALCCIPLLATAAVLLAIARL